MVYVRLHGNPKLFYSEYPADELMHIKETITKATAPQKPWVYFNNTASTAGILNALALKQLFTTKENS